jgi:hypothetical protein
MAQRERTDAAGRLPVRLRLRLRRQGRLDGRRGVPDPFLFQDDEVGTTTTAMRARLAAEFGEEMANLLAERVTELNGLRARFGPVDDVVAQKRAELSAAQDKLRTIEGNRPGPGTAPERRRGDELQTDDIVRARRAREQAARENTASAKIEALTRDLATGQQERADLVARINALRAKARADVAALRATAEVRLAVYDHALLRRHPDADLVRRLLDDSLPGLPGWLAEDQDETPEDQGEA